MKLKFSFLVTTLFSSKNKSINECVVQVHDAIVASLNRNHAIWLNYDRLRTLDTIGMVFYKRLFFHFSNTYRLNTPRSTFKIEKDYEDICREWLGGLKPEKYKSRIEKQLGKYLESVKATGLISRYEIATRVRGSGFKIVFYPGEGFYQDYTDFYLKQPKRTAQLPERTGANSHPLQLVAYFHELLGHNHNNYTEKERGQAAELLKLYSDEEARALIEHAVREGKKTKLPDAVFWCGLRLPGELGSHAYQSDLCHLPGQGDHRGQRRAGYAYAGLHPRPDGSQSRKHQLSTLTQPVSVFVCAALPISEGFRGKSRPCLIHRVWGSGKAGVGFWERGCGVLGKSQFANRLKTKAYLAFSAPLIPFKYIF